MVDYKIFRVLHRFVCICQYDFYSNVCFYAILVIGGIFDPHSPIWGFADSNGARLTDRPMPAVKQGLRKDEVPEQPAILAFVNGHGYNLTL